MERKEKGQALVELALTLPLIVVFITGIVDVGRGLTRYMTLTQVAHEGTRYFATLPGLTSQQVTCQFPQNPQQPCPIDADHNLIQQRVTTLLALHQIAPTLESITTTVQIVDPNDPTRDDSVHVRITTRYPGVFPAFAGIPITVEARAPYLY